MLKMLGITAATTLAPKIAEKIGEGFDSLYDTMFGPDEEEAPVKDKTKITQQQALYIQYYHKVTSETAEAKTRYLNEKFGLNKSTSTYARIWNRVVDISKLPEGEIVL